MAEGAWQGESGNGETSPAPAAAAPSSSFLAASPPPHAPGPTASAVAASGRGGHIASAQDEPEAFLKQYFAQSRLHFIGAQYRH